MRTAFIDTLCEAAAADPRIWLVCGDLGYSVLEKFSSLFPDRFLNAGVAEQNMTGIAAGLALTGKVVFTYSIANFPVMRCLEQIRNDIGYHNLNVKIVAVGGGLAYGSAGYSHHGVEDLAVMRAMPNMAVVAPGDPAEARALTRAVAAHQGPCYLRLGKAGEPKVHAAEVEVKLGQAIWLKPAGDVTLASTGASLALATHVAGLLEMAGIDAGVLSLPTLLPLDDSAIRLAAQSSKVIAPIEEHGWGGLGTAVGECLALDGARCRFIAFRLPSIPSVTAGSQADLLEECGMTAERITFGIRTRLRCSSASNEGM